MANLTPSEQAQLASLPFCMVGLYQKARSGNPANFRKQPGVYKAILDSGCAEDFACLCKSPIFLYNTITFALRSCSVADGNAFQALGEQLCGEVNPSLRDTRGPEIISVVAVMMVISTLGVVFRLTARFMSAAPYGADDNLIIAALLFTYGLNVNEIVAVHYGLGQHQLMLNFDQIMRFLQSDWTIQLVFGCSISLTRLSLLFFYRRIFATKRFHYLSLVMLFFIIGWWIAYVVAVILSCRPVNAFWDQSVKGHCMNEMTLAYGLTATELAINVVLLVMPVPWIKRLRLPTEKKVAIWGVFMLGGFVLIACSLRFPFLAAFEYTDASWTIAGSGIWVNIEANVGIASVCLPVMRPLFNALHISNLRSSFSSSRGKRMSTITNLGLESGVSGASKYSCLDEKQRQRISYTSISTAERQRSLIKQTESPGTKYLKVEWQRPASWLSPRSKGATFTVVSSPPDEASLRPEKRAPDRSLNPDAPPPRPPTPPPKDPIYVVQQRSSRPALTSERRSLSIPRKPVPAPLRTTRSSQSSEEYYLPPSTYSPGPYRQLHSAAGAYHPSSAQPSPSPTHSRFSRRTQPSPTANVHPTLRRLSSSHLISPTPSSNPTTPSHSLSQIQDRLSRETLRQERAEARLAEARRVVGEQRKRSHSALEAARVSSWSAGGVVARESGWARHTHPGGAQKHREWRESRGYGVVGIAPHPSPSVPSRGRAEGRRGDHVSPSVTSAAGGRSARGGRRHRARETGKRRVRDQWDTEWGSEVPRGRIGVRRSIELRRWNSH